MNSSSSEVAIAAGLGLCGLLCFSSCKLKSLVPSITVTKLEIILLPGLPEVLPAVASELASEVILQAIPVQPDGSLQPPPFDPLILSTAAVHESLLSHIVLISSVSSNASDLGRSPILGARWRLRKCNQSSEEALLFG
jgi:hypothetical protein